jgi:hypothetical protein
VGDARARGQHPTDDQNGGEREQTVEIVGRQNTKRQATIANLISSRDSTQHGAIWLQVGYLD